MLKRQSIKWYLIMQVRFKKEKKDQTETVEPHFHGRCHVALKVDDLEQSLQDSDKKIMTSFLEYQRQGSNWTLDKVMGLTINVAKYKPLRGSNFIPLPIKLRAKKSIVNVQNKDEKCFQWAILSALHPPRRHAQRVSKYTQYVEELDFSGIEFPLQLKDVSKFENQNKISVNVFGHEKDKVYPLHLTKKRFMRHVDLLVISSGNRSHYCWIKNFNRLMNNGQHDNQKFYCCYCLHGFWKKRLLNNHMPYCQTHGAQRTEMPSEENKWLNYSDVSKQLKVPFVVYADFECITEAISTCQPNICKSSTTKMARHVPSGFTYKIVGPEDKLTEDHVTYRGNNVAETFVEHMVQVEERLITTLRNPLPLKMSTEDEHSFQAADKCFICMQELGSDRVRDHCHVTRKFRCAAHNACNLNLKQRERIPVFFHNLKGYDSHLIMQAIGKMKNKRLNCIPQNHENYISFSMGKLDFIDTFQFLSTSLEKLVLNLAKEGSEKFIHLRHYVEKEHPGFIEEKLKLLMRKGVYPYE